MNELEKLAILVRNHDWFFRYAPYTEYNKGMTERIQLRAQIVKCKKIDQAKTVEIIACHIKAIAASAASEYEMQWALDLANGV